MTDLLDALLTEQVDDQYANLDTASVAELAAVMNDADATVPSAVRAAIPHKISTIATVRLGKTYGNLMVDLRVTNAKLRHRAVRIVRRVTGATRPEAEAALDGAGPEVKTAILMLDGSAPAADPRGRLAASGGRLRDALEAP